MGNDYKDTISKMKKEADNLMTKEQMSSCGKIIHTASAAAAAGGFVPIPVMDAVPISAAQITMVIALGKVFNQTVTDSVAKGIIGAAASTLAGRTLAKAIPIVGWAASATIAAGVTEAIGWTTAVDFAKRGSQVIEEYDENQDEEEIEQGDIEENEEEVALEKDSLSEDFSKIFEGDDE